MVHRHLHKAHSKLKLISPWYFLAAALISGTVSVYAMRQNNLTMVSLRNEVFAADKKGGDVEKSLKNLQRYIYSHMNTNLNASNSVYPPIQLKYTYERLVETEKTRVATINERLYKDAQTVCQQQPQATRLSCVGDYVTAHSAKEQPITASLYQFDFVSPSWTPDLAGWSLLTTAIVLVLFCFRYGLECLIRHELQKNA